ncbi:MAG: hypothetical protein RBR67_13015 [Desulfobacterium sp.]|jgi:hypothetical protein|nr:hypothetical protein [Desulfobacterium sp.]
MDHIEDRAKDKTVDPIKDEAKDQAAVQQIKLENGQTLFIKDLSRRIGADAFQVIMEATVEITVKPDLFSPEILGEVTFEALHQKVGDRVTFKHRAERNFIMTDERKAEFEKFVSTFKTNVVPYLSKPLFPAKFVMKTFRE